MKLLFVIAGAAVATSPWAMYNDESNDLMQGAGLRGFKVHRNIFKDDGEMGYPAAQGAPVLAPQAYIPLPAGSVTPKGWLLKQLKLQAEGLSGHLAQFWNDIQNSIWIGGTGDGGLHERTPYWLNGIVPLAYLLRNAGEEKLPKFKGIWKIKEGFEHLHEEQHTHEGEGELCTAGVDMKYNDLAPAGPSGMHVANTSTCDSLCKSTKGCVAFVVDSCHQKAATTCWLKSKQGTTNPDSCKCYSGKAPPAPAPMPSNIMDQVKLYMDHIIAYQAADGWLGPGQSSGGDYWGRSNIMFAMLQYAEAEPAVFEKVTKVMLDYMLSMKTRLTKTPLTSWAAERWIDMSYSAQWLLEHAPQGHEQDLWDLSVTLHDQGSNWEQWFETFTGNAGGHNVNNAQGLKSAAVWYRQARNESLHALSRQRMANLDRLYGLPTGMYNGDEILPSPPTRNPSRGIELCGVVEAMFSYNVMFSTHGDVSFADRVERITYNALPATWASPKGGDMWAHQYLQAVNEINAVKADPHVWTHDGDMAETYGLEPNYGCCTANFNQGWPKFANMLIYTTQDKGAAVAVYAPAVAALKDGTTVEIDTTYPFGDSATVKVSAKGAMPLYMRVPTWATKATIDGKAVEAGTMHKIDIASAGDTSYTIEFNPEIRLEAWDHTDAKGATNDTSYSIHRGALMYSYPLPGNYTVYASHYGTEMNDYYVTTTTPWAQAIVVKDPKNPAADLKFESTPYADGDAPFNHSGWTNTIAATLRSVPGWDVAINSAAPPPASPACANVKCGDPKEVKLVPHGSTDLRMGELPLA